jgi:hypothetical protein
MSGDEFAAAEAAVERGGDADEILRAVLEALHEHGLAYTGVRFVEDGSLVDGPSAGTGEAACAVPVTFDGQVVGELALSVEDTGLAARLAELIAPYVLVGWDTGGEAWEP